MRLGATAKSTTILEDSNSIIKAAKLSGECSVDLRQNLTDEYIQKNADTIVDAIGLVQSRSVILNIQT